MGKRQHQKDKMYLTYTEWTTLYGGKKSMHGTSEADSFKRLPLDHCCLSLQPWKYPYCDRSGNIFDLEALVPFLKRFKINPVTGQPLEFKELIKLNFHRNTHNQLECPVLFKEFSKNSHICAIATTGNVFLMEAIDQLNIKTRNWKDLLCDEPFERKDIITLQDPLKLTKFDLTLFYHIKQNLRLNDELDEKLKSDRLKHTNPETLYTLMELEKDYKQPTKLHNEINKVNTHVAKADKFNAAHFSKGAVAASFTSTAMVPKLTHEVAIRLEEDVVYDWVKKKGYVRLVTNLGPLNLELYCDQVPKACDNFIKLCKRGIYDGTKFHRSIRNFMVQGGDPTGTGAGGESAWGGKFRDEFRPNLSHNARGVLSMANSGKHTNGSQFFITYRICKHLDNKHTIFGRMVGGMETLNEMEKIEVDNKDKPIYDIIIQKTHVFVDPFEEAEEYLAKEREEEAQKELKELEKKRKEAKAKEQLVAYSSGVGKYINPKVMKYNRTEEKSTEVPAKKQKKNNSLNAFNFKNW